MTDYVLRLTEDEYSVVRQSLGLESKRYDSKAIQSLVNKIKNAGYAADLKQPKQNAIWDAIKSYGQGAGG